MAADRTVTEKTIIECQCGQHLLMVQSDIDYHFDEQAQRERFSQDIYLAMFSYGNYAPKRKFWFRFANAFKYLRTGEMFKDQLTLTPEEATKLADFINANLVEGEE